MKKMKKMKTINLGARSVNVVVGYRNLGELSEKIQPFSEENVEIVKKP